VVAPLASFFDVEGFLADVRQMIDQQLEGFHLIAAVQAAIDSRFDSAAAPQNFTRGDMYQLHEQSMARVNSSIEGWTERTYESGEWRLFMVLGAWFQDLFNIDLHSVQREATVVVTGEDQAVSFSVYYSAGWRQAIERVHRTATLSEWHEQHGRHTIFAGGKLVPINTLIVDRSQFANGHETMHEATVPR
jgi:uncharacterized radical SAM superfamily Fe-S cluster-containing enzyme